ncbi:MAG: Peroxiredoxin [Oscillospiraceae bacterium]|nr:Peroxiredoxin [Oscillospiraceae bacterium]
MNVFDFTVLDQGGSEVPLSHYDKKVLLIVNTATGCGFTPQYDELQNLYETYQDRGFEIMDFPCNQFGNQAPGSNEEIHNFCTSRYNISFEQFAKIDVLGPTALPLYQFLTEQAPFQGFDLNNAMGKRMDEILSSMNPGYQNTDDIKWNFTKFLLDRSGNVVARYEPTAPISAIQERIEEII